MGILRFFALLAAAAAVAAAIQSAERDADAVGKSAPRARKLESVPTDPVGELTGEFLNLAPTSMGPAAPVFSADVNTTADVFATSPAALESTLVPPKVRLIESASCSIGAAVPSCAGNLSICLSVDISNSQGACACYTRFAKCFDAAGCLEWLPSTDVNYCRFVLYCSRPECDLSGAYSHFASAAALVALLASIVLAIV